MVGYPTVVIANLLSKFEEDFGFNITRCIKRGCITNRSRNGPIRLNFELTLELFVCLCFVLK